MSSGEVANPITVEEANQAQLQHQSAAAAASAEQEEGEESDSAIGDNFADDDFRRMLHSMVSNRLEMFHFFYTICALVHGSAELNAFLFFLII